MPKRRVQIIERKLGRDKVYGWAKFDPPRIELDERLRGKQQQEILIHELLHIALPQLDEDCVTETARWIADHTWSFGLRRIQPDIKEKKEKKEKPGEPEAAEGKREENKTGH
jgi:hypothetical protein